jgi:hypothetical protein
MEHLLGAHTFGWALTQTPRAATSRSSASRSARFRADGDIGERCENGLKPDRLRRGIAARRFIPAP